MQVSRISFASGLLVLDLVISQNATAPKSVPQTDPGSLVVKY